MHPARFRVHHRFRTLNAPLLLPTLSLAVGIAIGNSLPASLPLLVLAAFVAVTACTRRWPLLQSLCLCLCFLAFGTVLSPGDGDRMPDDTWTEAVVASTPAEKPKTVMADLLLPSTGERRRCFIWKDDASLSLLPGDNIMVSISSGQFVHRSAWRRGGDGFNHLTHLQRLRVRALKWRAALLQRISRNGADDTDAEAVVAAMVLGDKSAITPELRESYAVSGASHILALSGLHIGIIYLLFSYLTLGRLGFRIGQVLTVLAIWTFALVTGLSPSVVRAATMITVYSLFAIGGRQGAPLGVLCFTAMLMLVVDSRALFDVGFQLSFAAMFAILLLMPLFHALLSPRWRMEHRIATHILSIVAMSVAAQIGTSPLVAYYFGRFSTWFLLTNIVAIPAASIILYGAVVTLLLPVTAGWLIAMVGCLNCFLAWVASLPLASIEGLHPTPLQVAMVYVIEAAVLTAIASRMRMIHAIK